MVAYAYVYADPDTGIVDASSAYESAEKMQVKASQEERDHERWAGLANRLADDHEDSRANDTADPERGQVERADGPVERGALRGLTQLVERLRAKWPGRRDARHVRPRTPVTPV
jgi:hypothetical protein